MYNTEASWTADNNRNNILLNLCFDKFLKYHSCFERWKNACLVIEGTGDLMIKS